MTGKICDTDNDALEREECWFHGCGKDPKGRLHDGNGFAPEVCDNHGESASELNTWERYERVGTEQ